MVECTFKPKINPEYTGGKNNKNNKAKEGKNEETKKNRLLKENQIIKNRNFENECNGQVQISEINNLKKENEDLYGQIDRLKIELSKLDKLIYGKVRTNF